LSKRASIPNSTLSVQVIVLATIAWSVVALLFFLFFSVSPIEGERPGWYSTVTYILENVALLTAGLLCFRNWRSSLIVSGRTVWLAIGLGMFSYFIGNLCLAYWEIGLGLAPDVSPGDFFFILTYLFLCWGMLQAVISKRLNLALLQWVILAGIAVAGIAIALVFAPVSEEMASEATPPAIETTTRPDEHSSDTAVASPNANSPAALSSDNVAAGDIATPSTSSDLAAPPTVADATSDIANVPAWAIALDEQLRPLANAVSWIYIVSDVILVVMATTLLLAFWGGRFSQSWRFIAAAAFSFYVADIWFNYAISYIPNYQTGALPEVFWIFSGCLFGVGAALEYHLSTRRRSSRRRN